VLQHGDPLLDALGIGAVEVVVVARERIAHAQVEAEQEVQLLHELLEEHLGARVHPLVVLTDLVGEGLQRPIARPLHLRHVLQHLRRFHALAGRVLLLRFLRGARAHQTLEAATAGDERQDDHLDAGGHDDGEEGAAQDGEAERRPQANEVVLALERVGEIVRLFGRHLSSSILPFSKA
jgi:hypothetical protein